MPVFAPEAHMPRDRRLIIDGTGVVIETGFGVQHRLAWSACEAAFRFPDRLELVLSTDLSVVIRESDWFHGDQALALADRMIPASLWVEVPGVAEPTDNPYSLSGLSRSSSVLLATLIFSCVVIAIAAIGIGAASHSPVALTVGIAVALCFCLPVYPLVRATRTRLSVPSRWRLRASNTPSATVRFHHQLAVASNKTLQILRVAFPIASVLAALGWHYWTGRVNVWFVVAGVILGTTVDTEIRRR